MAVATRFGRVMLAQWALDPAVTYLNHGTVGAPPRRVLAAQQAIRDRIERQPSKFLLRELSSIAVGMPRSEPPLMRDAAAKVAAFLGARGEDLAFVDNASSGVNAVLRSFPLAAGDEIVITDHAYGGVALAAQYYARMSGATVRTVELPYPLSDPAHVVETIAAALGPRTRLLLVDHITSTSALVLPLAEIAAAAKRKGVAVLVDGAHAPGAIPVALDSLGVDWYSGNLHKWAWSPRSCGVLWAAPDRQAGLHPPVISWGLDQGLAAEFDWVGTRDPSPALAAPEGLAFMEELGVAAVQRYNHDLAWHAAQSLTARWGTALGVDERWIGTMATFPLPAALGTTSEEGERLRDRLLFEDAIEIQIHGWRGGLWVRVSAQIYNEPDEVEKLGRAIEARAAGHS